MRRFSDSSSVERWLLRWLLEKILRATGRPPVRWVVRGNEISLPGTSPIATVTIPDYATLIKLLIDPQAGFGAAYADGAIAVDGDLVQTGE